MLQTLIATLLLVYFIGYFVDALYLVSHYLKFKLKDQIFVFVTFLTEDIF